MHPSSLTGTPDMASLSDLHEGSLLHNLKVRYFSNEIYVSWNELPTWSVISNDFKWIVFKISEEFITFSCFITALLYSRLTLTDLKCKCCLSLNFFQTYIGSILVAVNPYKPISGLYSNENLEKYSKVSALLKISPTYSWTLSLILYQYLRQINRNNNWICVKIVFLLFSYSSVKTSHISLQLLTKLLETFGKLEKANVF